MMAASSVNQGIFVPLQTCATLGVNMVTGLLVWEDWLVIDQWVAYFSLYALMALGIYLLTTTDVLEMYKRRKAAKLAKNILKGRDVAELHRATDVEGDEEEGHAAISARATIKGDSTQDTVRKRAKSIFHHDLKHIDGSSERSSERSKSTLARPVDVQVSISARKAAQASGALDGSTSLSEQHARRRTHANIYVSHSCIYMSHSCIYMSAHS